MNSIWGGEEFQKLMQYSHSNNDDFQTEINHDYAVDNHKVDTAVNHNIVHGNKWST